MSAPPPVPVSPPGGLPDDGATGTVLTKLSNADGDADWELPGGGGLPGGGSVGQVIVNTGPGAGTWQNAPPAAPLAHASSHESGGSDPITNLGYYTVSVGADVVFDIKDDPYDPGQPSLRFYDLNGVERFYVTPAGVLILDANDTQRITLSSAGLISLLDDVGGGRVAINGPDGSLTLSDASSFGRVQLRDDGTGLILNDASGAPKVSVGEAAINATFHNTGTPAQPAAKILSSDASLLLEHYDSAGTGTLLSSLVLAEPGSNALVWKNADESERISLRDDGTGLIVRDGDSVIRTQVQESEVDLRDSAGVLRLGLIYNEIDFFNDLGVPIHTIAESGIGFFGASPYGQDVFVDPTLITPEQLANYQIARGWMAAV